MLAPHTNFAAPQTHTHTHTHTHTRQAQRIFLPKPFISFHLVEGTHVPVHVGRHTCGELPTLRAGQELFCLTSFGAAEFLVGFQISWLEAAAAVLAGHRLFVVIPQMLLQASFMFEGFVAARAFHCGDVAEKKEKRFT